MTGVNSTLRQPNRSKPMHTLRLIGRAVVTCVSIDGGMIAVLLTLWVAYRSPRWVAGWVMRKRRERG
jgi:hypothetical protein